MAPALTQRVVPLPPSTYIAATKISIKLILAIIFLVLLSVLSLACLCYICIRRRKSRNRAKRLAKDAAENKALPPKINRRNARFFGPGIVREEEIEMASFLGQDKGEVSTPKKVRGGWREVLRAGVRR